MDDSLQRKMMGFPFEKYDKSNLGGTGVAWVRAGRKKRGYFRECRLWFSMLRGRAQTCSICETRMGTAETENVCVTKTMLTLAASKCLRGGERERWVACYCQPIVLPAPAPTSLPTLTRAWVTQGKAKDKGEGLGECKQYTLKIQDFYPLHGLWQAEFQIGLPLVTWVFCPPAWQGTCCRWPLLPEVHTTFRTQITGATY